jgi:hypothetical protein
MEAFSRLPQQPNLSLPDSAFSNNSNANNNRQEDQPSFLSLSQFDVELQQQAQLAMQQEIEAWQDFENYLPPVEYSNSNIQLYNHHQHQLPSPPPTTANDMRGQSLMNGQGVVANTGLPMNSILSTIKEHQQQTNDNISSTNSNFTTPMSEEIKLEYSSPERVPFTAVASNSPPNQSSLSSFSSPDSLLHTSDTINHNLQSPDHILNDQHFFSIHTSPNSNINTPLETPFHSPKNDILFAPNDINFQLQHGLQNSKQGTNLIY